jgi:2-aminoadipate transaminase
MAASALSRGIAYVPGSVFFPDGRGQDSMRLAYSRVDDARIEEGARRLGYLLREALAANPRVGEV